MVQVVPQVPDGHVLKNSAVYSKGLIRPGPDLSSISHRDPRAPILQPWITPWEEVRVHVH